MCYYISYLHVGSTSCSPQPGHRAHPLKCARIHKKTVRKVNPNHTLKVSDPLVLLNFNTEIQSINVKLLEHHSAFASTVSYHWCYVTEVQLSKMLAVFDVKGRCHSVFQLVCQGRQGIDSGWGTSWSVK